MRPPHASRCAAARPSLLGDHTIGARRWGSPSPSSTDDIHGSSRPSSYGSSCAWCAARTHVHNIIHYTSRASLLAALAAVDARGTRPALCPIYEGEGRRVRAPGPAERGVLRGRRVMWWGRRGRAGGHRGAQQRSGLAGRAAGRVPHATAATRTTHPLYAASAARALPHPASMTPELGMWTRDRP